MGPYRRKLCWDSPTSRARIVVSIERFESRFIVHRKGWRHDWSKASTRASLIGGIVPYDITEFGIEQEAIAFADNVVERHIKTEHFSECPDAPEDEFPR
jgi:hypothetical protein